MPIITWKKIRIQNDMYNYFSIIKFLDIKLFQSNATIKFMVLKDVSSIHWTFEEKKSCLIDTCTICMMCEIVKAR